MKKCIKLLVNEHVQYLEDSFQAFKTATKFLNKKAFERVVAGDYIGKGKCQQAYESKFFKDQTIIDKLVELGFTLCVARRSVAREVLRRYSSFDRRNGKVPYAPTQIAEYPSIVPSDVGMLQVKDGKLLVRVIGKHFVEIPYVTVNGKALDDGKYTGQIRKILKKRRNKRQTRYVITLKQEIEPILQYEYTGCLGIDINRKNGHLIALSSPINNQWFIPATQRLIDVSNRLRKLNAVINDRNKLPRNLRRHKRTMWFATHKKQEAIVRQVVSDILTYVEKNKLLLCIDNNKTGTKLGSYGQDKIQKVLKNGAEKRGIPYAICPTHFTTKLCHKCHKVGQRKGDKFICEQCGEIHADTNGAMNVQFFGEYAFHHGFYKTKSLLCDIAAGRATTPSRS